jgi:hypothetical protein
MGGRGDHPRIGKTDVRIGNIGQIARDGRRTTRGHSKGAQNMNGVQVITSSITKWEKGP